MSVTLDKELNHWDEFPMKDWRWGSFKPSEMRSKSDDKLMIDYDSMDKLQELRNLLGKPLYITSAYRSPAHNRKVGGAKGSMHLQAKAFDVQMHNRDPAKFYALAQAVGFTGFGFYEKSGFIHIDTGPARSWNKRWFDEMPAPNLPEPVKSAATNPFAALVAMLLKLFGGTR